ncbi:Exosome component 10 [Galdieria sulphuraria]|uniref:Exosome complex exonuclease RRP6 n=1 Tax=Galdieria sulphuraria TaxID=130081 RepID=M2XKN4_GALSU|nr:exosome complex exonuclease RRP6 [Galdieria sulphuraria]EME30697.1 exosome complex exonuclease RRP6 [Galdieria sulphuraria]GJD10772.1 Exosome component 10 [Galdieria sulphuraria]|eukprot:XP_005707217.1 exosome complex exonuclease RRP6 [Galdieria sulphuraria]
MTHNDPVLKPFRAAVNCFNQLPLKDELDFYEKTCQPYSEKLQSVDHLLKTCLGQIVSQNTNSQGFDTETDLETIFENTQEAVEFFLEQTDDCLDALRGIKKTSEEDSLQSSTPLSSDERRTRWKQTDMPKPQKKFPDYPINNLLTDPNVVATPSEFSTNESDAFSRLDSHLFKLHQKNRKHSSAKVSDYYQKLLKELKNNADSFQGSSTVTLYLPLEDTKCTFVNSLSSLEDMITKLEKEKEIAVDIENHSYRSFQGFICLLQFSTRQEDFVVDAIELRGHLKMLSKILENGNILKVLHGADSDVQWLQRDFGLYIVHMFDTGQASRQLKFPFLSLSYLLKRYCNIDNSKTKKYYQLADWRIRPLPEDMFSYARQDTHYLLYIYDRLCEELRQSSNCNNNLLTCAYRASIQVSMLIYEKPQMNPLEYQSILSRRKLHFDEKQTLALRTLCRWRDEIARIEDESLVYVLPEKCMIEIAKRIPQSESELRGCCPYSIPPLLKTYENEVLKLLQESIMEESEWNKSEQEITMCCTNGQMEEYASTPSHIVGFQSNLVPPISVSSNSSLFGSTLSVGKKRSDLSVRKDKVDEIRQEMLQQISSRFREGPFVKDVEQVPRQEEILSDADDDDNSNNYKKKEEEQLRHDADDNVMILVPQGMSSRKRRTKKSKKKKKNFHVSTKEPDLTPFFQKISNEARENVDSEHLNNKESKIPKNGKKNKNNSTFSSVRLKLGNRSATF